MSRSPDNESQPPTHRANTGPPSTSGDDLPPLEMEDGLPPLELTPPGPVDDRRVRLFGNVDELPPEDAGEVDLGKLPKCPECGYALYRLAHLRCPECGVTIRPSDLCLDDQQRLLIRQARFDNWARGIGAATLLLGVGLFMTACLRGPWSVMACLISPLVAVTVIYLGRALFVGEPAPRLLCFFGLVWFVTGGLFLWHTL